MKALGQWRRTTLALATVAGLVAAPSLKTLAAAPGTPPTPPAASTPASKPATSESKPATPALQTKFESGDPLNGLFTAMALRFNVIVVQVKPVKAYVLKDFELPDKLEDALALARRELEPQGFAILQSAGEHGVILRIVSAKEGKAAAIADGPVTYGTQAEKIDISKPERLVTHILPVNNPELIDTLRHNATSDPQVTAEIMGTAETSMSLMIIGPAAKVQAAVEAATKVDAPVKSNVVARTMVLKKLNAASTADSLNDTFSRGTDPMKAVADTRTNSIIVTGPEDKVLAVMVELLGSDMTQNRIEAPTAPVVPPPRAQPVPEAAPETAPDKPGARRNAPVGPLDGTARGGDNAGFNNQQLAVAACAENTPIVNKGAFW